MRSEVGSFRAGDGGGEGQKVVGRKPDTTLLLVWLPWDFRGGGCKAFLLLIGQFTLFYPVFSPFWGIEKAAA